MLTRTYQLSWHNCFSFLVTGLHATAARNATSQLLTADLQESVTDLRCTLESRPKTCAALICPVLWPHDLEALGRPMSSFDGQTSVRNGRPTNPGAAQIPHRDGVVTTLTVQWLPQFFVCGGGTRQKNVLEYCVTKLGTRRMRSL
ncbi:hypothetical protein BDZ89DRAFT_1083193, partial [Hymenopellis radicata]